MRSEWLEYFSDVVQLGSIKASASLHHISPQGLSKSIRSLETELGLRLLERNANSVCLTPEGAQLLPFISSTVSALQKLNIKARDLTEDKTKTPVLILCSTFVLLCGMMEPLRNGLNDLEYQTTCIQVDTESMPKILIERPQDIHKDKAICGFPLFFSPIHEENSAFLTRLSLEGYEYIPFLEYSDGVLVSSSHPLALQEQVSKADIEPFPTIASSSEQLAPLTRYLGGGRIKAAIADLTTRLQMILDNQSMIFVPPFIDAVHNECYRFIPLTDPYTVELGFVYDRSRLSVSDVAPLLETLSAFYRRPEKRGGCKVIWAGAQIRS